MNSNTLTLESTLTCPVCGHRKTEVMPTDACQWFYRCDHCLTVLTPKQGDCCVFCSFGSYPCPPIQAAQGSQGAGGDGCAGAAAHRPAA